MGIFRHYLTLALFAAGLLFGVQAPNFVDQYEKRIDAHLIEARAQLGGFLDIADRMYDGDVQKLIAQHAGSGDEVFRAEQQVLTDNFERLRRFEVAQNALETHLAGKVIHILFSPDRETFRETVLNYTAAFPLTTSAILCGLVGALFVCIFFELIVWFLGSVFRGMVSLRSRRHTHKIPRQA